MFKKFISWFKKEWDEPSFSQKLDEVICLQQGIAAKLKEGFEDLEYVCLSANEWGITLWKEGKILKLDLNEAEVLFNYLADKKIKK